MSEQQWDFTANDVETTSEHARAKESFCELLACLGQDVVNSNILTKRNCPEAASLRGLLLGRKSGEGASWDELWLARLQQQVPNTEVTFNESTGLVTCINYKTTTEQPLSKSETIDILSSVSEVVLKHWPSELQLMMLGKDGKLNRTLLVHLFHLSRKKKLFYLSKVLVDYDTHWKLIQCCLTNAVGETRCRVIDARNAYAIVVGGNSVAKNQ